MRTGKTVRFFIIILLFPAIAAVGQEMPFRRGTTEITVWAGGGSGLGHSDTIQVAASGVRVGRMLTAQHGSGALRGNLEYAFDVAPLYLFFQNQPVANAITGASAGTRRQTVYGGGISPFIFKWNFTGARRVVPYAGVESGAIFTTRNVPAGDTSVVNFASGIASGVQIMRGERRAFSISGHLMHISNASIGSHNPGLNVALQLRIGYQWWR